MKRALVVGLIAVVAGTGCCWIMGGKKAPTYGEDLAFLKKHTDVVVLKGKTGGAQVAVVPLYQGRVMTSAAAGPEGLSFGWINRKLIASGDWKPQINAFGGEERMWLGPEGGQFSLFFKKGDPQKFEHWQTPAVIDWGGWSLVKKTDDSAQFTRKFTLTNYSGTTLDMQADRTVRMVGLEQVKKDLGITIGPDIQAVAFESDNRVTNVGYEAWEKKTGVPSIWILCMFNPSPDTTIVVPFKEGPVDKLGPIVNDAYFGKVPADRLVVKGGVIFFKADGKKRGKIGVGPKRAKPVLGSYDAANCVLTLATYTAHEGVTDYVNSMWKMHKDPYNGDVVNSYNDGPTPAGPPLGPFYELESSSPAAALKPGATMKHVHRTIHLQGPEDQLDPIAKATLGVTLDEIKTAFQKPEK